MTDTNKSNQNPTEIDEVARRAVVRKLLTFSGLLFVFSGAVLFLYAADVANSIDADVQLAQGLGGILALVGLSDFVLAKVLFKSKKRDRI